MAHKADRRRFLLRRSEGRRQLRRSRQRWKDNIKMDIQEMGWGSLEWVALDQDRDRWWALGNAVMKIWVP